MNKSNGNYILATSIIVIGLLIGIGVFIGGKNNKDTQVPDNEHNNQQIASIDLKPVSEEDHILGNFNADVILIEYSDTECPFCKKFHETMNSIMETQKYHKNNRVAWVYRHFPLDNLHSKARTEAYATECAAELGGNAGFWKYINKLYEITPSNNGLDLDKLPEIAEETSLDRETFEKCLSSNKYRNKIQKSLEDAMKAGAQGTPYTIAVTKNGEKYALSGALPDQMMEAVLDVILNSIDNDISIKETTLQIQKIIGR